MRELLKKYMQWVGFSEGSYFMSKDYPENPVLREELELVRLFTKEEWDFLQEVCDEIQKGD